MKRPLIRGLAPATLTALAIAGCGAEDESSSGAPITAAEARPQASANAHGATTATADVLDQLRAMSNGLDEGRGESLRLLLGALDELSCDASVGVGLDENGEPVDEEFDTMCALERADLDGMAQGIDEMLAELQEKAELESDNGRSVVYRIGPDLLCESEEVRSPVPVGEEGEPEIISSGPDEACVQLFTDFPVRVVMTSPAEGDINLTLQLGAGRHQPVGVALHSDQLAGWIDLGTIAPILGDLSTASGEDMQLPIELTGRIEAALQHDADAIHLSIGAPNGVNVEGEFDGELVKMAVSSGTQIKASLDGTHAEARLSLSGGQIELDMPSELELEVGASEEIDREFGMEAPAEPKRIQASIGGIGGEIVAQLAEDRLTLSGLQLAPWTLDIDGTQALEMLFNPEHDHEINGTMQPVEGGVEIALSPAFDLRLTVDAEAMAKLDEGDDFAEEMPEDEAMGVEWMQIKVDGANEPRIRLLDSFDAGQVQMVEGNLTISTSASDEPLIVEAGMCMAPLADEALEGVDESADPFAGMQVTACE
ncbi:MAG: hypothetical protein ACE366_03330 [Bradymonadia bacterium]